MRMWHWPAPRSVAERITLGAPLIARSISGVRREVRRLRTRILRDRKEPLEVCEEALRARLWPYSTLPRSQLPHTSSQVGAGGFDTGTIAGGATSLPIRPKSPMAAETFQPWRLT